MALTDVDVVSLINTGTAQEIASADYARLRFNLLQRTPIGNVIHRIDEAINTQSRADKERFAQQFTIDAFAEQKRLDQEETRADAQEEEQDNLQRSRHMGEIHRVAQSLRTELEPKKLALQSQLEQALRNEAQLQQAKRELEEALRRLTTPVQESNVHGHDDTNEHRHPTVDAQESESHHHGHPQTEREVHGHSQRGTEHGHPSEAREPLQRGNEHGHPSPSTPNEREIQRISSQLQALASTLEIAKGHIVSGQADVARAAEIVREVTARSVFLQEQITSVLPEKQLMRMQRATHRLQRGAASLTKDEDLQQLSPQNRDKLKQKILAKYSELDGFGKHLLDQAVAYSYSAFLTLLENMQLPNLRASEEAAIRSILKMMKSYRYMEAQLAELNRDYVGMTGGLSRLQGMVLQNEALTIENAALSLDKTAAEQRKQDWFNVTLFSGGRAILLAGIGYGYELSPLFFMCPAALAALSVVAAITTLAYYCSQHTTAGKVVENEGIIAQNNATVLLPLSVDKTLAGQITTAEQEIERLRTTIREQETGMERILNQASQVEVQKHLSPGPKMFGIPEQPTAPPQFDGQYTTYEPGQ